MYVYVCIHKIYTWNPRVLNAHIFGHNISMKKEKNVTHKDYKVTAASYKL